VYRKLVSKDVLMTALAMPVAATIVLAAAGTGSNLRYTRYACRRPGRQLLRLSLYFSGVMQIVSFRPRSPMLDQLLLRTA
jgi:hypothetical protein